MKTLFPNLVPKNRITKRIFMNNITLKKYKECNSREGMAFSADFYYKGVKLGEIQDNGMGGELQIETYSEVSKDKYEWDDTIHKIFDRISKGELHRVTTIKNDDGSFFETEDNLATLFYHIVDRHINTKEINKIYRKGIILESKEGSWEVDGAYRCIAWKQTIPAFLKRGTTAKLSVERELKRLIDKGERIINEDYLKSLGLVF